MKDSKALINTIIAYRVAIRNHRDQRGDDRCWIDDYGVWKLLPDSEGDLTILPPFDEGMRQCQIFFEHRRALEPDPLPADAINDPNR